MKKPRSSKAPSSKASRMTKPSTKKAPSSKAVRLKKPSTKKAPTAKAMRLKKLSTKKAPTKKRKLKVSKEQWALPVSLDNKGELVSMRDAIAGKTSLLSHGQLSLKQRSELVAARIEKQPKFELSMIVGGVVSKKRAIAEVRAQSSIGKTLIEIEQRMIAKMLKRAEEEGKD